MLSALGYAGAALLYRRWLADAAGDLAVSALMAVLASAAFHPGRRAGPVGAPAAREQHRVPWPRSGSSIRGWRTGWSTC